MQFGKGNLFSYIIIFDSLFHWGKNKGRNKLSAADVKIKDRQNKERKRRSYLAAGKLKFKNAATENGFENEC